MDSPRYYILDPEIGEGRVPVDTDLMTWAHWMEGHDRHVAKDMIGTIRLSTVFLGLDHAFMPGPPLLFETMAFDESDRVHSRLLKDGQSFARDIEHVFERYSTWEAAELGHRAWKLKLEAAMEVRSDDP